MTHTISSNISIFCLFGLLLAYQTTCVVSAETSSTTSSAATSSTMPKRRTLTRGALGAKSASRDMAPLEQKRELGIGTMVSSVFDAMEAVGVAGDGMNRLINRAGGATGPDDELANTGPEDDLVITGPEDDLVNRGGGGATPSTVEYWHGKGKGKGYSGSGSLKANKAPKAGKSGCRGKSGGKSGAKAGWPTSSHSSGKGKGSKGSVRCGDDLSTESYSSWEDPHSSWEDPYPSWEDPVREESPDLPPIDGGDPMSGVLPVQESKDEEEPMCGYDDSNDVLPCPVHAPCCGSTLHCGSGATFCGEGCLYGDCWDNDGDAKEDDTLQPVCGREAGGKMCPAGECCSSEGHCGNGVMHCGEGCQSGNCDHCYREDSHSDMVSQPVCGRDAGGKMCPDGQCCSKFGFCGAHGPSYCGEGCQSGNCYPEGSHNGMPTDVSGVHDAPTCGEQAENAICPDSQCCSKFGYCGADGPAYCGEGCQSGNCYPEGSPNAVTSRPVCGLEAGGEMCPDGQCCSEFGYCGADGPAYCGEGCQSGNCYPEGSPNDMTSQPVCGREAGGKMCPDGQCCSEFGFCSDGPEFCGSGCQSGKCYHCYPEGSLHEMPTDESDVLDAPTCGMQAAGAKCPDGLCCSLDGWCGVGEAYCGIGCQSGDCVDPFGSPFGSQELSKDNTEGEDAGYNDSMMPIGSSGECLTAANGEKYCDDPSHCCSKYNYCGLGDDENYCGKNCVGGACWASGVTNEETEAPATGTTEEELGQVGCHSGDCFDFPGNQELSKDDTEGGDAGHDDNMMPIGSSGKCLTNTANGEKYCDDPSHCCSKYNYCGLDDDENYCGENCVGGACWASGATNEEAEAPATGTTEEELGHSNTNTTEKEDFDGEPKEMQHGTGYGSGIGMYAVCLGQNDSVSNDFLEDSVYISNEVIVNYQYALNTVDDADLDEVLTLLEYQVHNLLLLEKMDCSLAGRRKLQAGCYPEAIVSSPREVEITDTVCQESETIEGTKCHVVDGGFGVFVGTNPECSLFAEDEIRQDYLAWVRGKMTEESRSGLPPAIETVDGAAGISFRGAIMPDNRAPVVSTGAVSGFQTQNTGEDVSSKGITALGGFLIGFICAGIVAIAFLVSRRRNKKDHGDEEPILHDDKGLRDLEQDMGDTSSDEGTVTTLTAGAVDHLQIRDNKTIIPFGNVGEAEIGDDVDSRVGAEPLSSIVEDANLFDMSQQSQGDGTTSTPTLTPRPHFCDSPLCEMCCGTVATPQDAGCCMISSPCMRNNAGMEERPYTTPDTVEF